MVNQNSLPVIQSLWIGDSLSVMERLCIASFLQNGHPFHLYTYNEIKNIPEGAILINAGDIINPDQIFKYKDRDSYSGFSNVFRYKLLLEKGNYWVDTDVVCLRPFDDASDYVFATSKNKKIEGEPFERFRVESCVIKSPPGSDFMDYCYNVSRNKDTKELVWGEIGPYLLRSSVKKFGLERYAASSYSFCPIDWPEWNRYVNGSLARSWIELAKMTIFRSKGAHLWNEMWRLAGIDKNSTFPANCIFEKLKRKYLGHTP